MASAPAFGRLAEETAVALGLPGDYEQEQLAHFGELLNQADRFIDVGANHGLYARLANHALHGGYIGMVEANPELAAALRREAPLWPSENANRIEVFGVAAADGPAWLSFFLDDADDLGRIDLNPAPDARRRCVEVRCEALDTLFEPAPRTVIKIDVEGFEYRVVLGATRLLAAGPRVILELHAWGDGQKFPVHVFWLMYRLGFAGRRIGHSYSCDFERAGFIVRTRCLLRAWPKLAAKYFVRRAGLRPLIYQLFWPNLASSAGK